ncbi:MAG: toll/interleukin-1 receptor domain-containing protein [Synergistaceae bacterium]|jgi:hypothetical protein|nr:toll/interleukin-1 receptor domain-containing protein [Synergistaceae bacterium]
MEYNMAPCKIGEGPFVFVSYAHDDLPIVSTVIEGIVASGYKVWYDKNIDVSSLWSDEIANAILASKVFIVFVTKASMASQYVRSEVEFALSRKVKVIPVYIEGMDVLPPGLSLILHSTQGLEGNNPQIITFKICKWLTENWEEGGKERASLVPVAPKADDGGKEKKSVWKFLRREDGEERPMTMKKPAKALQAYMERPPRVLGHASGVPTASSSLLKWLLRIVLFTNITELLLAYQTSGNQIFFGQETYLYWILPSFVFYWYFDRRFSGPYSLFSFRRSLGALQSLLYWALLLGWLLMVVNLESFKIWVVWAAQIVAWFRLPYIVNFRAILALDLPAVPEKARSIGFLAALGSSGLLLVDMVVAFFRRKFLA